MKAMIKGALLASVAAVPMTVPVGSAAQAQTANRNYSIPAQALDDALRQFSSQSGRDIVYDPKLVQGKSTEGLRGSFSVEAGLRKLIGDLEINVFATSTGFALRGNVNAEPGRDEDRVVDDGTLKAGAVVDDRTGAALKGALVELIASGEKASTNEYGEFRFPGKSGSFEILVSYLGYPEHRQAVELKGGRATTAIRMGDGAVGDEIVVTAYKSARAQALNQERSAENVSTVISDDLTGKFDGTTISDALRRAPAVTFIVDPATGDGTNVIIRGMAPEFNTVTLNGNRLPVGDGVSRSPTLNNILADSVSKITINKTLLPNQDGSGTGALVEIETKGPLDRPERYLNIQYEHALSGRNFLSENSLSGTASVKLGASKNIGISVSAQYRRRNVRQVLMGTEYSFGPYLPSSQDGRTVTSMYDLDPRIAFPFEPGVGELYQNQVSIGIGDNSVKNFALGASLQWSIGGHTDLRLDYSQNNSETRTLNRNLQIYSGNSYVLLPVDELGGEVRPSLVWENIYGPGLLAQVNQYYSSGIKRDLSSSIALRGNSQLQDWEFDYRAGYSSGSSKTNGMSMSLSAPNFGLREFTRDQLQPSILGNTAGGQIVSLFPVSSGSSVQLPGLNDSGFAAINDEAGYGLSYAVATEGAGRNDRATGAFDVKKKFSNGFLKYLQVGTFLERSTTKSDLNRSTNEYSSSAALPDLGLTFTNDALSPIGQTSDIRLLSLSGVRAFFDGLRSNDIPLVTDTIYAPSPYSKDDKTDEIDMATYLQAFIQIGKLEIIGGARFERVKATATNLYAPVIIDANGAFDQTYYDQNSEIRSMEATVDSFLPRLTANYRFNKNLVARFGYYKSIARPSLSDINQATSVTLVLLPFYGPNRNQPLLQLFQGNPALKSAETDNLDVSLEWYASSIGVIKFGAFYKPTKNSFMGATSSTVNEIPAGIEIPDDPRFQTPNLFVQYTRPENSPDLMKLWGIELSIERQFKSLPGILSGLGVYANYTYTKSSRTIGGAWSYAPGGVIYLKHLSYDSQSPHSGTAAVTYSRAKINGSLSYTYQSGHYTGFPYNGLQYGRAAFSTLDFKLDYTDKFFGREIKVALEGSNLLKGPGDSNVSRGKRHINSHHVYPIEDSYLGGRTLKVGLSSTF